MYELHDTGDTGPDSCEYVTVTPERGSYLWRMGWAMFWDQVRDRAMWFAIGAVLTWSICRLWT